MILAYVLCSSGQQYSNGLLYRWPLVLVGAGERRGQARQEGCTAIPTRHCQLLKSRGEGIERGWVARPLGEHGTCVYRSLDLRAARSLDLRVQ